MANKNISNLTLDSNPASGDFLATWDVSAAATKRILINKIVAMSPEQAETIPTTGTVSGARNVGIGDGEIFLRNYSGILEFRQLNEGANITITTSSGSVSIASADPPAVPWQQARNIGNGTVQLFSGLDDVTGNFRTLNGATGISFGTGPQIVTVNGPTITNIGIGGGQVYSGLLSTNHNFKTISGLTGITIINNPQEVIIVGPTGRNVGNGAGTIFHSITDNYLQFKTIVGNSGIQITNNTGNITLDNSGVLSIIGGTGMQATTSNGQVTLNYTGFGTVAGSSYTIKYGSGRAGHFIPYALDVAGNNFPTGVMFTGAQGGGVDFGSPILSFPAGVGTYMIDFIFGIQVGSISSLTYPFLIRFKDITNNQFVFQNSHPNNVWFPTFTTNWDGPFVMKRIEQVTGPISIQPFISYTGDSKETVGAEPYVQPTGTSFSWVRLA